MKGQGGSRFDRVYPFIMAVFTLCVCSLFATWLFDTVRQFLVNPKARAGNGFGPLLVMFVLLLYLFAMACGFIWLAFTQRPRRSEDLPPLDRSEFPALSENSLICRSASLLGGESCIIVDFDSDTIHFKRCYTPNTFLAVQRKLWVCPLSDILSVERRRVSGRGGVFEYLNVVTKTGTARIMETATNFEVLSQYLLQRSPHVPKVSIIGLAVRGILASILIAIVIAMVVIHQPAHHK
jgi:hypothetical protein